ncbi:MAG: nitroreductase/quinone reductase family protein [Anaerolineae bacterium]
MSIWTRLLARSNAFALQVTHGRLGSQMGPQSVLLLHTVGRKSGKPYATPLSYYRDGENYLVVASNWGQETPPDWFRNLERRSRTTIEVKGATLQVEARPAQGEEYTRLWELVTRRNAQFVEYQKRVTRRIPVVVLTPVP